MFATKLPKSVTEIPLAQEPQQVIYPYATACLVIMKSSRISGAVALILLMGVAIWGGTLHFLENGTNIAGEALSPVDRNEQVLLDGLADGRILYFKIEDYRMDRIIPGDSNPPHRVIIETWWQPDAGDQGELNVVTMRDQDGGLLQYTQGIDGRYTTTFVSSGETMEMNVQWGSPAEWIDWIWNLPQTLASNPDFELKGIGELNGRATLYYVGWSDSRKTRWEQEFVEDAPLLLRRSDYRIDSEGVETLTQEETLVEYRLLPPGNSIPQLP